MVKATNSTGSSTTVAAAKEESGDWKMLAPNINSPGRPKKG